MRTPHGTYFTQLYRAVLDAKRVDQATLDFAERIHEAIQPYLRDEYQTPQPPLHEV